MEGKMLEVCMCGAADCRSCGPAQGFRYPPLTAREAALIARRADKLLSERLQDRAQFADLMDGIEPTAIYPHLHRALMSLDSACKGNQISRDAVFTALSEIQRLVHAEAEQAWREECEDVAAASAEADKEAA